MALSRAAAAALLAIGMSSATGDDGFKLVMLDAPSESLAMWCVSGKTSPLCFWRTPPGDLHPPPGVAMACTQPTPRAGARLG